MKPKVGLSVLQMEEQFEIYEGQTKSQSEGNLFRFSWLKFDKWSGIVISLSWYSSLPGVLVVLSGEAPES